MSSSKKAPTPQILLVDAVENADVEGVRYWLASPKVDPTAGAYYLMIVTQDALNATMAHAREHGMHASQQKRYYRLLEIFDMLAADDRVIFSEFERCRDERNALIAGKKRERSGSLTDALRRGAGGFLKFVGTAAVCAGDFIAGQDPND